VKKTAAVAKEKRRLASHCWCPASQQARQASKLEISAAQLGRLCACQSIIGFYPAET